MMSSCVAFCVSPHRSLQLNTDVIGFWN